MNIIQISTGSKDGNAYYVETTEKKYLFDCGCSLKQIKTVLAEEVLLEIDYVIISHCHSDHIHSLHTFLKKNTKALVYIKDDVLEDIHRKRDIVIRRINDIETYNETVFEKSRVSTKSASDSVRVIDKILSYSDRFISELPEITTIKVQHFDTKIDKSLGDDVFVECPNHCFKLRDGYESLIYLTDCGDISKELILFSTGATYGLIEKNHNVDVLSNNNDLPETIKKRIRQSHMSDAQHDYFVARSRIINVIPIHGSDSNLEYRGEHAEIISDLDKAINNGYLELAHDIFEQMDSVFYGNTYAVKIFRKRIKEMVR